MKIRIKDFSQNLIMLVFVLGMGSLYFQIQRMPIMAAMMIISAAVMVIRFRRIQYPNFYMFLIITAYFLLNSLINRQYGFRINDLVIWLIKGVFMVVLTSSMTFKDFKDKFVRLMFIEACISLFCFLFADVLGITQMLPLLHTEQGKNTTYILTPYYTLGWGNIPVFHRNAGLFLEPGMHHIPLNIALYYLLSDVHGDRCGLKRRKYNIYVIIFVITVLTTKSTTGYLCLGVILLAAAFRSDYLKGRWKLQLTMFLFIVVLVYIELQTGVVADKLEGTQYGRGSGLTRYNDTIYGYYIAFLRPWTGYGVFSESLSSIYLTYGIRNISNGMASYCCQAGYPAVIAFLLLMYYGIKKNIDMGWKSNVAFFIFLLMCLNTEGVFMNLFK